MGRKSDGSALFRGLILGVIVVAAIQTAVTGLWGHWLPTVLGIGVCLFLANAVGGKRRPRPK